MRHCLIPITGGDRQSRSPSHNESQTRARFFSKQVDQLMETPSKILKGFYFNFIFTIWVYVNVVLFVCFALLFMLLLFCFVSEGLKLIDWLDWHASKFQRSTHLLPSIFRVKDMLVLGIWTQVLRLVLQALHKLNHLLSCKIFILQIIIVGDHSQFSLDVHSNESRKFLMWKTQAGHLDDWHAHSWLLSRPFSRNFFLRLDSFKVTQQISGRDDKPWNLWTLAGSSFLPTLGNSFPLWGTRLFWEAGMSISFL